MKNLSSTSSNTFLNSKSYHNYNDNTDKLIDITDYLSYLTPNETEKDKYYCPNCKGHNFSFKKSDGKVFQCWNGCERKDIVRELKTLAGIPSKQFMPNEGSRPPVQNNKVKTTFPAVTHETTVYRYSDFQEVRKIESFDKNGDRVKKRFEYWSDGKPNKGNQEWGPYRVVDAAHKSKDSKSKYLYIVEGEKDVDTVLDRLGLPCVTFPSYAWSNKEYLKRWLYILSVFDKQLVIMPDNDAAGHKKADFVIKCAAELQLEIILAPTKDAWDDCPNKGDITDWVESQRLGMNQEQIENFIELLEHSIHRAVWLREEEEDMMRRGTHPCQQPDYKVDEYGDPIRNVVNNPINHLAISKAIDIDDFLYGDEYGSINREWIVPDILPKGSLQIIAGDGGTGKSYLAYHLGKAIATGENFLGVTPSKTGKVFLVTQDESIATTKERLETMGYGGLRGKVSVQPIDKPFTLDDLENTLSSGGYEFVLIDCLQSIKGAKVDENSEQLGQLVRAIRRILQKHNVSGWILHHTTKDGENFRGHSSIKGEVDEMWKLQRKVNPDGSEYNLLTPTKKRDGTNQTVKYSFDTENSTFTDYQLLLPNGQVTDDHPNHRKSLESHLLDYIFTNEGVRLNVNEIIDKLSEEKIPFKKGSLRNRLGELINKGLLESSTNPDDYKVKIYHLPSSHSHTQNDFPLGLPEIGYDGNDCRVRVSPCPSPSTVNEVGHEIGHENKSITETEKDSTISEFDSVSKSIPKIEIGSDVYLPDGTKGVVSEIDELEEKAVVMFLQDYAVFWIEHLKLA